MPVDAALLRSVPLFADVLRGGEVVGTLGPTDFFGEGAILVTIRRSATVTAKTNMTVAAMFGADFAKFEHDSPELHARIAHVMAERNAR